MFATRHKNSKIKLAATISILAIFAALIVWLAFSLHTKRLCCGGNDMAHRFIIGDPENPTYLFEDETILDITINTSSDVIADELSIDTIEANVICEDKTITELDYGTEVTYINQSGIISSFYLKNVVRVGSNRYTINAQSLIGMMDNEMFYGDVYTNKPFPELVSDIIKTDSLQPNDILEYARFSDYSAYGDLCGDRFTGMLPTITMRDSFKIKFRFLGFQAGEDPASSTSWDFYICGVGRGTTTDQSIINQIYGVYGTVSRSSTSVPFPETPTFYFRYRDQSINIGTFQVGQIYEIEAIPTQGKLFVNGVEYSFTGATVENNNEAKMVTIGGGTWLSSSGSPEDDYHDCKHDLYEWKITSETGEVKVNFIPLYNRKDGKVYIRTAPDGVQRDPYCADDSVHVNRALDPTLSVPGALYADYREDIIAKLSFSTIASNMKINGWLPILTKREALHYLLMSTGLIIKKDDSGGLLFTEPIDLEFPIPSNSIYMEGKVDYFQKVNEIQVEEHAFLSTMPSTLYPEPTDVLFEVISPVNNVQIWEFNSAPAQLAEWQLMVADTIYGYCANAVLFGSSSAGEFKGFLYKHQTSLRTKEVGNRPDGGIVSITGIPIITAANSDNVLDRIEEYYTNAHIAHLGIVKTDERCGSKYSFMNPFFEEDSGYMTRMSEKVSAITKGNCEFLCGYTGQAVGDGYTDFVVLEGSGTWEVPESVFEKGNPQIRVYLIGGGQGGSSGYAGENGKVNTIGGVQARGEGGKVGESGQGGKVYTFTLENPDATLSYSCGTGGEGGAICTSTSQNNLGSDGTATTLVSGSNSYSSESGSTKPDGVANVFNNERYAMLYPTEINGWGTSQLDGSDYSFGVGVGGYGGYFTLESGTYYYHQARPVVGVDLDSFFYERGAFGGWGSYNGVTGGGGGGAGYGQNGSNGTASSSGRAGNGGNGGNATAVPQKVTDWKPRFFGVGGCGGGGGGAGGNSGLVYWSSGTAGSAGLGGYGGKGGTGGDGCVLIYY